MDAKKYKEQMKGMDIQPFYKQFPISTELLRAFFLSGGEDKEPKEGEATDDNKLPVTDVKEEDTGDKGLVEEAMDDSLLSKNAGNAFDKEKAQEFLDFEGDFSIEISEESTKFDLNRFAGLESASKAYDLKKKLLLNILKQETFKDDFKDDDERSDLANALADWVWNVFQSSICSVSSVTSAIST